MLVEVSFRYHLTTPGTATLLTKAQNAKLRGIATRWPTASLDPDRYALVGCRRGNGRTVSSSARPGGRR
jgi:hypothetical protein